ncbi:DUF3102 domain-containing protein, partial [Paenibacillus vulneris]
ITAEINSYKQIAGNAIFEIGRRLKHVKESKLAEGRGGWTRWCTYDVGMDRAQADKFVKIVDELGEAECTYTTLGLRALYEIATLPAEERERPHTLKSGVTKIVEEMTVRELREVKAALKKAEEAAEAERKARERAENEAEVLRQTIDSIEEQPPRIEYVRDDSETERLKRYENRFGDIET